MLYADKDGKQHVPEGARRLRRRQLDREPAAAAQLGLGQVPGRAGQLLGPGRHATTCGTRPARSMRPSTSRCTCTAARPWPASSRTRPRHDPSRGFVGGYELETLSLGLPFMAAFLDPGAWGRELHPRWRTTPTWPACGSSARTCRRRTTGSRCTPTEKDKYGLPIPNVHFDDHPNDIAMRSHAYPAGHGGLRGGRRDARSTRPRPIPAPTISAPTG